MMDMDSAQGDFRVLRSPLHQLMQQHGRVQAAAKSDEDLVSVQK